MANILHIGNNIRLLREKKDLTQRALADQVLVSFQAISAWERGLSIPDLENAVRLASFFDVSVDALLSESGQAFLVGIDGDSNKTEFVMFEKDGTVKNVLRLGGSNPNDRDLDHCITVLSRGLEQVLGNNIPQIVFAGVAGLSQASYQRTVSERLGEKFHTKVVVDWDAANVLSMGAEPENSIAVVCGTGSSVYVRKGESQYHYGGWGYLFDQAGSAYDVGKDAIRCTLAQEDGLTEATLLTDMIHEALGGKAFDNISTIYKNGRPYIAAFSKFVLRAAQQGDASACAILQDNAARLALLIKTAAQQHGAPGGVIASGGFLKNEMFREMVEMQAGIRMEIPDLPSVYGACVEAMRANGMAIPETFHQKFLDSYQMIAE